MQQQQGFGNAARTYRLMSLLSIGILIIVGVVSFWTLRGPASAAGQFRNPIVSTGSPDPWMTYFNGNYYLSYTTGVDVRIRKAASVQGLHGAPENIVWSNAGAPSNRCCNVWAPEFHRINGPNGTRWYLYYTADNGSGAHGMFVLESSGDDPLGPYSFKSQLDTGGVSSIDGTVFRNSYNNRSYFLWSTGNLWISEMSNPWTLTGPRLQIASPIYDWEKVGGWINEGPEILQRFGKIDVIYSATGCGSDDYSLGRLTVPESADLLNSATWQNAKNPTPVFSRNDANGVFAPGHNGFFTSPDGSEDWIVYHGNSAPGQGCGSDRTARIQKFTWNSDGTPNFGTPVSTSTSINLPSGDPGANPYVSLQTNVYKSIQATNPGFDSVFFRHRDSLGWISQVTSGSSTLDKQDSTFKIVPGLADSNCYSFESRNYPGSFMRHANYRLHLAPNDGSTLLKQDATFCARPGLAGYGVSFESYNFPNYYLRHFNGEVYIAVNGGYNTWDKADKYELDTSWNIASPWAP